MFVAADILSVPVVLSVLTVPLLVRALSWRTEFFRGEVEPGRSRPFMTDG